MGIKWYKIEGEHTHVKGEPRPGSTEQNLSVLPLTKVVTEVGPACLGNFDLVGDHAVVRNGFGSLDGLIDILESLLHVAFDIEGETGCFGDGESEVKRYATGHTSKTDEETPAVVDGSG